jgi:glycosyltransferase involved in cell wall biosynthesis
VPSTESSLPVVLVLTSSFPRYEGDTSSIFLQYLYRRIKREGYEIHVLAPDDKLVNMSESDGVVIHHFRYFARSGQRVAYGSGIVHNLRKYPIYWIQVPMFTIAMAIAFLWLLIKLKPSIVHAHWLIPMGFIAGFFKPFFSYRNIITSHGSDIHTFKGKIATWMRMFTLRRADVWTTNSHSSANLLKKHVSPETVNVIPMGVDIKQFSSGDRNIVRSEQASGDRFVVLFVGRLVRQKGVQDLIAALAALPTNIRERCQLWIVGDGIYREQLGKQVLESGLGDITTFLGNVPHTRLPDFYAAADLFVGPSIEDAGGDVESQGVVYLEAFASGTPVLATTVGGIADTVEHNVNGLLVEPQNPAKLSEAIAKLYSDPTLRSRLAEQATNSVKARYDWEIIGKEFVRLYNLHRTQ